MLASLLTCCLRIAFLLYRWFRPVYDGIFVKEITTSKIPKHLTVAVKSPKFATPKQIADFADYARSFGIPELTIYNTCNWKQILEEDLANLFGTNIVILSENESIYIDHNGTLTPSKKAYNNAEFVLRLIPFDYEQRSGLKGFIFDNLEPNTAIQDKWQLQKNGLPDLVLISDGAVAFNSICLSGFPSWLLKTAELGTLPDLDSVRRRHLQHELVKYSKSTQRFGH